jgi:hypothetical protein
MLEVSSKHIVFCIAMKSAGELVLTFISSAKSLHYMTHLRKYHKEVLRYFV